MSYQCPNSDGYFLRGICLIVITTECCALVVVCALVSGLLVTDVIYYIVIECLKDISS